MAEEEPNVVFAFSPAQAVQGLLDYTKSEHSKIYKSAIREVCKEPFECEADGLYQFLKDIQDRADKMGWSDGILNITLEVTDNNEPVQEKLIDNYGAISLEQVVESKLQYINEQGREAQDTFMLYKCLMASLSNSAKKFLPTYFPYATPLLGEFSVSPLLRQIPITSYFRTPCD